MKNGKSNGNGRSIYSWFQGSSSSQSTMTCSLEEQEEQDLKRAIELSLQQQIEEQKKMFEQFEKQCAVWSNQKRHRHRTSTFHSSDEDGGGGDSGENSDGFETISFRKVKQEKVRDPSPCPSDDSTFYIEDISVYMDQCIKEEPSTAPAHSPQLPHSSPPSSPTRCRSPSPTPSSSLPSLPASRPKGKQKAVFVRKAHKAEADQDTRPEEQHNNVNLDQFVESLTVPTRKVYARKPAYKGKQVGSLSGPVPTEDVACPVCFRRYRSHEINLHASGCTGAYSDDDNDDDELHDPKHQVKVTHRKEQDRRDDENDDDDNDCIVIDPPYSHTNTNVSSVNTSPSTPKPSCAIPSSSSSSSSRSTAKTMAAAILQNEEQRRKRRRISRNDLNNYYATADEDMEGHFEDAGFASNVSTLSWESRGWSNL